MGCVLSLVGVTGLVDLGVSSRMLGRKEYFVKLVIVGFFYLLYKDSNRLGL